MPETYLTFGGHNARVMIEDKEIPHYAINVDPEKKEVTCWIASEAEKVCEYLFHYDILFISTNLGLFCRMVQCGR